MVKSKDPVRHSGSEPHEIGTTELTLARSSTLPFGADTDYWLHHIRPKDNSSLHDVAVALSIQLT